MEFQAALLLKPNADLVIAPVRLIALRDTDVLVRMEAAGLCHTDLEARQAAFDMVIPSILGHEGCGIVEDVGSAVRSVRKGDRVVCSVVPSCGSCFYCRHDQSMLCAPARAGHANGRLPDGAPRLMWQDQEVGQFRAVSSFAQYAVIPESGAIRIPSDMPADRACMLGCAILTGVGAVLRVANVKPGDSVCVVGCGPIGLSVLQGARLVGAGLAIALDPDPTRQVQALHFGADQALFDDQEVLVEAVKKLTSGRGADHVLETAGTAPALQLALELTRPGGTTTLLGKLPPHNLVSLRYGSLMGDKTIRRSALGGARAQEDIPAFARAYLEGRLKLDEMVTERLPLQRVNEGLQHVADRSTIRTVINDFSLG